MSKLNSFEFEGQLLVVRFVETQTVKEGVECDIYSFIDDSSKDLAIVRVTKGHKTPLQLVLQGNRTVEGFVHGKGVLTVRTDIGANTYDYPGDDAAWPVTVAVGQVMQWQADIDSDLEFYEVCDPPYRDGRFKDLPAEE